MDSSINLDKILKKNINKRSIFTNDHICSTFVNNLIGDEKQVPMTKLSMTLRESILKHFLQPTQIEPTCFYLSHPIHVYKVLELVILTNGNTSFWNVTKQQLFISYAYKVF